jgi:hypothetical protein
LKRTRRIEILRYSRRTSEVHEVCEGPEDEREELIVHALRPVGLQSPQVALEVTPAVKEPTAAKHPKGTKFFFRLRNLLQRKN